MLRNFRNDDQLQAYGEYILFGTIFYSVSFFYFFSNFGMTKNFCKKNIKKGKELELSVHF